MGEVNKCSYLFTKRKFSTLTISEISDLQIRTKHALEIKFKDFLKHDWLEEGLNFSLMKYYTDLVWKRRVKEAMDTEEKSMEGLDELLYVEGAGNVCVKILVEGEYNVTITMCIH